MIDASHRPTWHVLALLGSMVLCGGCRTTLGRQDQRRPAIVLAPFGTSIPQARHVYDHIDARARARYPDHEIRWAFTSDMIIRKLKREGVTMQRPEAVIARLQEDGFRSVVLQSLHIAPGQEFEELRAISVPGIRIAVGDPLLASEDDMRLTIEAIAQEEEAFRCAAVPIVFAAHGNDHHPTFNRQLVHLNDLLRDRYPMAQLATIQGQPGTTGLAAAAEAAKGPGRVHFVPFMLIAGNHVMNDVMGDAPDAWKQVVGAARTTCAPPLGARDRVLDIFFRHTDDCLRELD